MRWFFWLIWRLGRVRARAVLRGLRNADGAEAADRNVIYTSSARFRDDIALLALHAGYSPTFIVGTLAGGTKKDPHNKTPIILQHTAWRVNYAEDVRAAMSEPVMRFKNDVSEIDYTGRTWCVSMPSTFIVVRCATRVAGFVTRASRPLILGNCSSSTLVHLC